MTFSHPLTRGARIFAAHDCDGNKHHVLAWVTTLELDPEQPQLQETICRKAMCRCSEISGGFGQGDRVRSDEQTERLAGRSDLTARSARCGKRNGRRVARRAVPRRMTGYCAEEKAGVDVGPSRSRFWTPQLGGERAYRGRLGKDRSLCGALDFSARCTGKPD
jgi:hypothetical protein